MVNGLLDLRSLVGPADQQIEPLMKTYGLCCSHHPILPRARTLHSLSDSKQQKNQEDIVGTGYSSPHAAWLIFCHCSLSLGLHIPVLCRPLGSLSRSRLVSEVQYRRVLLSVVMSELQAALMQDLNDRSQMMSGRRSERGRISRFEDTAACITQPDMTTPN